jgi:hypothetical protein
MLNGVITAVLEQSPEMIIAGVAREPDDLADAIRSVEADAVVVQVTEPGSSSRYRNLLLGFPALKVIAIASDGRGGFVHELRPWSAQLTELSAATLLAALSAHPPMPTDVTNKAQSRH